MAETDEKDLKRLRDRIKRNTSIFLKNCLVGIAAFVVFLVICIILGIFIA